jgi:hypothetical protein
VALSFKKIENGAMGQVHTDYVASAWATYREFHASPKDMYGAAVTCLWGVQSEAVCYGPEQGANGPEQGVKLLGLLLAGSTGQQEQVEMGWPDIHG